MFQQIQLKKLASKDVMESIPPMAKQNTLLYCATMCGHAPTDAEELNSLMMRLRISGPPHHCYTTQVIMQNVRIQFILIVSTILFSVTSAFLTNIPNAIEQLNDLDNFCFVKWFIFINQDSKQPEKIGYINQWQNYQSSTYLRINYQPKISNQSQLQKIILQIKQESIYAKIQGIQAQTKNFPQKFKQSLLKYLKNYKLMIKDPIYKKMLENKTYSPSKKDFCQLFCGRLRNLIGSYFVQNQFKQQLQNSNTFGRYISNYQTNYIQEFLSDDQRKILIEAYMRKYQQMIILFVEYPKGQDSISKLRNRKSIHNYIDAILLRKDDSSKKGEDNERDL